MPHEPVRRSTRSVLRCSAALFGLAGALLGGCIGYDPGGNMTSQDLFTYPSTPNWPQTVRLVDHRTGEVVWTAEVPVGQQLVMRFYEETDTGNPDYTAIMRWEMMPLGTRFGELNNAIPVPDKHSRRVDTYVRQEQYVTARPVTVPGPAATPAAAPEAPTTGPATEPTPPIDLPE